MMVVHFLDEDEAMVLANPGNKKSTPWRAFFGIKKTY
jgi:hypothetical protein